MRDEKTGPQEAATLEILKGMPSYDRLSSILSTGDADISRIPVSCPELPKGVLGINRATLDVDEQQLLIEFNVAGGRISTYVGTSIKEDNKAYRAMVLVFMSAQERTPGKSALFFGGVEETGNAVTDTAFDTLTSATVETVINTLPGVVAFLNQLADGRRSDNVIELTVKDRSQQAVVAPTGFGFGFSDEARYKEIKPLDSRAIVEHVKDIFKANTELVTRPEKDMREVVVEVEQEGAIYVYRAIGKEDRDEVSYSVTLRSQTGSLVCIADSVSPDVDYIFSTRYTTKPLSLKELRNEKYSIEFSWSSTSDASLDISAFRKLSDDTFAILRSHVDTLHGHIEH